MHQHLKQINRVSRYGLAFVFFYHGLIPKIIWLSPIEQQLVILHTSTIPAATISLLGGLAEILLALIIIFQRQSLSAIYIAAFFLVALLVDVMIVMPELLISAFNPVSINIASLVLCYLIYLSQPMQKEPKDTA